MDNIYIWNDHEVFKVSLRGSAIPIKYRGHYFYVCSQHQLSGCEHERISIMVHGGQHAISCAGVRFFDQRQDSDVNDIVAFDFTEPCNNIPDLKSRFFDFRGPPQGVYVDKIVFLLASGFPFEQQEYDLEDRNHIGTLKQKVICFPDHQPADPALLCIRPDPPLDFNPDGMSGGSVFVVQQIGTDFHANLAGMIVRGGSSRIHILHAGVIEGFLRACVS